MLPLTLSLTVTFARFVIFAIEEDSLNVPQFPVTTVKNMVTRDKTIPPSSCSYLLGVDHSTGS